MNYFFIIIMTLGSFSFKIAGCEKAGEKTAVQNNNNTITGKMKIKIGNAVFTATLLKNETANALKQKLPLNITMKELNGNEKFYFFPGSLPTNASSPGNIKAGDIMLYGDNCLVLFYKSFATSYSYTRIGKIDNVNGLEKDLGAGTVAADFELQ